MGKNLIISIIGGLGLMIGSLLMNAMFSSPPSRAEFDTFKVKINTNQEYIKRDLRDLKDGQQIIIERLRR